VLLPFLYHFLAKNCHNDSIYLKISYRDRITSVTHRPACQDETPVTVSYAYEAEDLKSITHNGFSYRFSYDLFRNVSQVQVADMNGGNAQTLMTTVYGQNNGPVQNQTYGNGDMVEYEYDKHERVTGVYKKPHNGTKVRTVTNRYNKNGELTDQTDHVNGIVTRYEYDLSGRVIGRKESAAGGSQAGYLAQSIVYDEKNRVADCVQGLEGGTSVKSSYLYGEPGSNEEPGLAYGMSIDGTERLDITYDSLGRVVKKTVITDPADNKTWTTEYTYVKGDSRYPGTTTLLVESVKDPEKTLFYTYDKTGNIIKVEEQSGTGTKTVKALYAYDSLGQLIHEDNKWIDRTVTYTYDQGGNMLTKRYYPYAEGENLGAEYASESRAYEYSTGTRKDQLTSFNGEGIGSYDAVGNPCSYRGKTLTWTDGRKLSTVKNGGTEAVIASYTYDQNGDRIKKTVGNTVTKFHTDNGRILIMEKGGKEVHFLYDQDGSLFSMKVVDGTSVTDYYYEKNLQGDIVGLIDSTGTRKVNYSYDSWGRPVSMTDNSGTGAGSLNPFRYRGYFYDDETGFYYVSSRYYDPEVGRFISPDSADILEVQSNLYDKNLYAYCDNNPVMRRDETGDVWIAAVAIGVGMGVVGQYVSDVIGNITSGATGLDIFAITSSKRDYLASAIGGGIAAIPGLNLAGTAAVGALGNIVSDSIKGNIKSGKDVISSAAWGAGANSIGYAATKELY